MICNQNNPGDVPDFRLLPSGRIVELLLNLIERCLLTFKSDVRSLYPEIVRTEEKIIERFYNGEFSHFFQITVSSSDLRGLFTYHDESSKPEDLLNRKNKRGLERQIDFGIRLQHSRERILLIEGKRLHNKNDRQYVSGNTGGICRFKREQHGDEIDTACIIGYMEIESFYFWHRKINNWITEEQMKSEDLCWTKDETLSSLSESETIFSTCTSRHARITKSSILLHHFWVDMK